MKTVPWEEKPAPAKGPAGLHSMRLLPKDKLVVGLHGNGVSHWDIGGPCRRWFVPSDDARLRPAAIGASGEVVYLAGPCLLRLPLGAMRAEVRGAEVEAAESMEVSNDGELVALCRGSGFMRGEVDVHSLVTGELLWGSDDTFNPIDTVAFSPSGELLMWEFDRPQQSGSDYLEYGAWEARTGRSLLATGHTSNSGDGYHWASDGRRLLFGGWGEEPRYSSAVRGKGGVRKGELIGLKPIPRPPAEVRSWEHLQRQIDALARRSRRS